MKLYVELFGALSDKLPDGEGWLTFPEKVTPAGIVEHLKLRDGEQFVVLVNGQPVAQEVRDSLTLSAEDKVVVFPPMEGG